MSAVVDAAAVEQLVLRERQNRDRGWWEEWADCFAEQSIVEMSWFTGSGADFVRQTRQRSAAGVWGRRRLSPPAVRVNGDRGWAELPLGIEFHINVGGVWRIVRITSIYERDSLTPSVPGTALGLDPADFAGFRPSYRALAWYLHQNGSDVPATLLGDDQPEAVARHYQAAKAWLTQTPAKPAASTTTTTKEQ